MTLQKKQFITKKHNISRYLSFSLLFLITPLTLRMYTPCFDSIKNSLFTKIYNVEYTLLLFLLVISFFERATGFISTKIDRSKITAYGLVVYIVGSILCATSKDIIFFSIGRIMQGFGAATSAVSYRASVIEFSQSNNMQIFSITSMIMTLLLLPDIFLAGWLTEHFSWRYIFIIMAAVGLLSFLAQLPYYNNKPSKVSNDDSIKTFLNFIAENSNWALLLLSSIQYTGFIIFLVNSPSLFITNNILTPLQYSICMIIVSLGYSFGSFLTFLLTKKFKFNANHILSLAITVSIILSIIFLYLTFHPKTHLILYFVIINLFQIATCFINNSTNSLLLTCKNNKTHFKASYTGSIKMMFAAICGLISIPLVGSSLTNLTLLLTCISFSVIICYQFLLLKPGGYVSQKVTI